MKYTRVYARVFLCLWIGAIGFPSSAHALERLFGTSEIRSSSLKNFPKWTGMLDRYFDDKKLENKSCSENKFNKCHLARWKAFLATLKGKPLMTQMSEVNQYMNRAKYILDPINWGVPDYWATPYQFFSKDGDCEDYAIAKFMSLRALGVPDDNLRVVILQDNNLNIVHAVLAVYIQGTPYILDNQIKQVTPASRIHHYRPIYSINEEHWWRHIP
jgi:predicted transglutaminase-like cysteine proteinase